MGRGTELAFNVQTLKKLAAETLTLLEFPQNN